MQISSRQSVLVVNFAYSDEIVARLCLLTPKPGIFALRLSIHQHSLHMVIVPPHPLCGETAG